MNINPINMKRIYQNIIEQFIKLIKDGNLKAGDKLPAERILAEKFNVSRSSIREAFRVLDIIGLIEVRPGEGTFITDLNIAPFINTIAPLFVKDENMENDLLEFRKMIELEAVKLAVQKGPGNKTGLGMLEQAIARMKEAIDKDDINLGAEADIDFHKAIFNITDSYILIKVAECISYILEASVRFNREKILKNRENTKELYQQHVAIYKAIKEGNLQFATESMLKHLNFVRELSQMQIMLDF